MKREEAFIGLEQDWCQDLHPIVYLFTALGRKCRDPVAVAAPGATEVPKARADSF